MRCWRLGLLACVWVMVFALPSFSYQEIPVTNGATIRGKVTITGEKPRPMAFNLVTIPDAVYCGRISTGTGWRIVEDFIIANDGSLKDVVVMLEGVKEGKPFDIPKVRVDAFDCDFLPFVNVLRDQDEITVVNMDPVEHDIQGYETARERGARVLFNRPLPMNPFHKVLGLLHSHKHMAGEPMVEKIHLRKGRNIFVMQCGFHPYMFSWGVVVSNPYFAITKEDGLYEISDVPPGQYILKVWHAGMKQYLERPVTVTANGTLSENFEYVAVPGRRSVHEISDNPRFGMELLGEGVEIVPSLRLQKP
ncbi:carboxypeptidase-like regulatory domain-containing protein [Candidatus Nitronereus thalassa]|uniref:Carboxypeptidase-like regulatory domain-containing protein n=1 Tax=Candidatus Nitronereus thalassa TaxID=3020898 RepID=A0ABU3KCN3_9BACT|nr:carboxypeptidase-like regulatory domain-containing protein [Candidatus Nitronereus thalassa]MDT7044186.1 carboxypeptidase-like regulatory domain-containing protein [Candidatus Nitronereus thalassa]